jgi:hypothetical protein
LVFNYYKGFLKNLVVSVVGCINQVYGYFAQFVTIGWLSALYKLPVKTWGYVL